jgi:hypothetical protein
MLLYHGTLSGDIQAWFCFDGTCQLHGMGLVFFFDFHGT